MSSEYHHEDELHQRSYDARLMRRLLTYVRPYRGWMLFAVLLLLTASLFSNLTPYLYKTALDTHIGNPERLALQQGDAGPAQSLDAMVRTDIRALGRLIGLIGAIMVLELLLRYGQTLIITYVGQTTMLRMRMRIFEHLQRMSLAFLDKNPVGRLMTRVTNDVEKIQETIVQGMVQVVSDLLTIVVVLGFMFWVNPWLALITLSTVPFVFTTSIVFSKYARRSYLEIRRKLARINAHMQETISGIRVAQVFGAEARMAREHEQRNREHRDEWFREVHYYSVYFPVVDFFGALSVALIVLYVGHRFLGGALPAGAAVGTLFAYVQWADRLYGPIRALADRYNLILEAMAASERIFELLDTPEGVPNKPDAVPCEDVQGHIEFRDVWFAYEEEQWVIKGLNLSIRPGERVAVVGHTGAGKTTLINLLSRFYDVQRGAVIVDGCDVRDCDKVSLRRHIGAVLQDVFLFSGSIEQNIRLGNRELDPERIRACAEHVNAARFIERLPQGYDYDVGERGCNLSTGQRQLLAFARTLAHDPRILVLDEATSSVDTETEWLIQDAIHKLMERRTCIVIAHRLSTVQNADRIVVMHHGEIREEGAHQELLARRGLYYRLYQLQYKDQTGAA